LRLLYIPYKEYENMSRDPLPQSAQALERIAEVFAALADPTRLGLLQLLERGPATVGTLVTASGAKQANVSKHLALLHEAGLLSRERDGAQVRYAIADPMVFDLCHVVCGKLKREVTDQARALGLAIPRGRR
jgi:DNA-binding transcriptional ArsR family regulator